ncbi:MAG: hypothetical protein NDI61_01300 [Bdellovibrionaceae bacterium]|nr:hypothetical protein [Pseudobdellovibrionaceae bacterium]
MKTTITVTLVAVTLAASSLIAADTKPSKEDRQKMAEMHTKMADCLKSDKPMGDCKNEMMKSCKSMMGKESCPMMDHTKGMMKGGMMNHGGEEK